MSLHVSHRLRGLQSASRRLLLPSVRSVSLSAPQFKGHRPSPPPPELKTTRWASSQPLQQPQKVNTNKEESLKENVLEASLNHVNSQGWNVNAISHGASDLGLSPAVSALFSPVDLVHFFLMKSNDELEVHLAESQGAKLEEALLWRLEKVFPYAGKYSEALALLLTPQNAPQSTRLLFELADTVAHYSLRDSSTNTTWYIRRLNIARLYVECEMCLVQDNSANFSETREFLKRRLGSFSSVDSLQLALPSVDTIRTGLVTLANILRVNAPR